MELNLNLDSLKFANVTSFTRTYGTKKTGSQNGGSLTTKEFNEVNALPFDTQRPIVLTENTIVSNAQYDAKLMVNAANITVTLRTESGTDGIVLMIATNNDTSVIVGDVTYTVKAGDVARFMYFNSTWNYINKTLSSIDSTKDTPINSLAVSQMSGLAFHNLPRATPKDISSYITDNSLWDRLHGTNGYSLFEDIFVGDYIKMSRPITCPSSTGGEAGSQHVMIAGINTLMDNGDITYIDYNHLVMVPGGGTNFEYAQHFGKSRMNSSDTTSGGYASSEMRSVKLGSVATSGSTTGTINQQLYSEFGAHLKTTRELLTNSVTSGKSVGWAWTDCQAVLMSEIECYGSNVFSSSGYDTGTACKELPLFRYSREARNNRSCWYWLKNVGDAPRFCNCTDLGLALYSVASGTNGAIRPRFVLA